MGHIHLVRNVNYNYLAILDADILLPKNYYQNIIMHFAKNNRLGIASGVYVDRVGNKLRSVINDRRSTPKALMVFQHHCFKDIGGILPLMAAHSGQLPTYHSRKSNLSQPYNGY